MNELRIGVLGAARIAPSALIRPAREVEGVTVTAVAARDRARAEKFATKHGIDTVFGDYRQLVESDAVDAVYNPLPNGLHGRWTRAAVAAGKHVLCEKPFTANAEEAATVAAHTDDRVVMEAFHYRYHPLVARVLELLGDGAIGPVRHVEAHLCLPLPRFSDIRYSLPLAGGALMDAGCYAIHALRTFGPGQGAGGPTVSQATAKTHGENIDRFMAVDVQYPDGATGRAIGSLWSARVLEASLRITGETGTIRVLNFVAPQIYHRLSVRTRGRNGKRFHERVTGPGSYTMQLLAFRDAVRDGAPVLTDAADAIPTMTIIDAAYEKAGLLKRQPTP